MIKSRLIAIFSVLLLITTIVIFIQNRTRKVTPQKPQIDDAKHVLINNQRIDVEVADTPALQKQGLSGRDQIAENHGMLFVFGPEYPPPIFWMKGMLIPIDIIWIRDNEVVKIDEKAEPPPSAFTPDEDLTKYEAPGSIDYVLEVGSGFCQRNNIKVGNTISINL